MPDTPGTILLATLFSSSVTSSSPMGGKGRAGLASRSSGKYSGISSLSSAKAEVIASSEADGPTSRTRTAIQGVKGSWMNVLGFRSRRQQLPLHRIEESEASESESIFLTDSLFGPSNTTCLLTDLPLGASPNPNSDTSCLLTDLPLGPPNTADTSSLLIEMDSPLESSNTANTSSLSRDSSLQLYSAANMSFISTDSSLQSYYTANTSTDSSFRSYYTANASVSSFSTINSISSHSSAYSVKTINSYKSRKTVLYRRREHPPPVLISSQELSESSYLM